MAGTLIIVESPAKAKKIQSILGRGYTVKASIGHICDLPKEYGVDLTSFEEEYELRNPKVIAELRQLLKRHDQVLLATDPDREGEAIAWHLARELQLDVTAPQRFTYGEITEREIKAAVQKPRPINLRLVDAARTRRVLDRIIGYDVSKEICWPAGAQSAGRVQTPALHLLCERERQIRDFRPVKYWTVAVSYDEGLTAFVPEGPGTPDPTRTTTSDPQGEGSQESTASGTAEPADRSSRIVPRKFASRAEAEAVVATAKQHTHRVRDVQTRGAEKKPEPPYTTSTVQQDASRKLRLPAKKTADLLQALFEAGYITYHRTDSTRLSDDAVQMARDYIAATHPAALPATPPKYKTKAGAQDAHEAIRPTHLTNDDALPPGTAELYAMIKARFLACQSKPAVFERTTVRIDSGPIEWVAEGSVVKEPGYLVFWAPYARQEDTILPTVTARQQLTPTAYDVADRQTSPPSRFDTGSLIKKLEISGVGRPSTYAMIIETLYKRGYVQDLSVGKGKSVMQPTEFGLQVDALLTETFPELVDERYTADMEAKLDAIESGNPTRTAYLADWYTAFRRAMADALPRSEAYRKAHGLQARPRGAHGEATNKTCDRCGEATYRKIQRKVGRGSFLACPACGMTRNVQAKVKPGACPKCHSALIERVGKDKRTFFGCVRYGAAERPCDYVEGADGKVSGRFTREETDKSCPKCGTTKLVILTPRDPTAGTPFYACGNRECNFTLTVGARRRKQNCPDCGAIVVERRRRQTDQERAEGIPGKSFWSCARYPLCTFAQDIEEPVTSPVDSNASTHA